MEITIDCNNLETFETMEAAESDARRYAADVKAEPHGFGFTSRTEALDAVVRFDWRVEHTQTGRMVEASKTMTIRELCDGRAVVTPEARTARAKAGAAARWQPFAASMLITVESIDDLKTILKRINRKDFAWTPEDAGHLRGTFSVGGRLKISGRWQLACAAQ